MRRVVSVWLPVLPADRIRRLDPAAASPLITVGQDGSSRIVAAADMAAQGQGLRPGMKLTEARILVPDLAEHPADPAGDAALLRELAAWCLRYAPLAAPDPPDGLWIDVTGSTHLQGGEDRLLRDLIARLANKGLNARAALAGTPGIAHAMARFSGETTSVVAPDAWPIGPFPIEALRLPPETCGPLRRIGIRHVHQLMALQRGPVARRFGRTAGLRLDQASGRVFEPIIPVIPPTAIQARLGFVEPLLTAEAFTAVIARLAAQACDALLAAGKGARRLDLLFERVDGSIQCIRTGIASPSRDARHLVRLLASRLEQVDPGLGVEAMRLVVTASDRLGAEQAATSLFEPATTDLAPLLDRLTNRLGEARVFRMMPVQSHMPERSFRRVAPLTAIGTDWPAHLPRPVRFLHPPQPVEAVAGLPDDPPVAFIWRRVHHRIRHAEGPERIAGEWWRDEPDALTPRDYFQVESELGRRFWLFRCPDMRSPRWFLHGLF